MVRIIISFLNGMFLFSIYLFVFGFVNGISKYLFLSFLIFGISILLINLYLWFLQENGLKVIGKVVGVVKDYSYNINFQIILNIIFAVVVSILLSLSQGDYIWFSTLSIIGLVVSYLLSGNPDVYGILKFTPYTLFEIKVGTDKENTKTFFLITRPYSDVVLKTNSVFTFTILDNDLLLFDYKINNLSFSKI